MPTLLGSMSTPGNLTTMITKKMTVTIISKLSSKLRSQALQIPNKKTFRNRPIMVEEVVTLTIATEAPTISQWDLPLIQLAALPEDKIKPRLQVRAFGCRTMLSNGKERSQQTKMPIEKTIWEILIMAQENHMDKEALTNIVDPEWTQVHHFVKHPTRHPDMKSSNKESRKEKKL